MVKNNTSFAGHFDGHADQAVQCQAPHPVQQIYGHPRCHQTPPLGKYLPDITLMDAMVINFGVKNQIVVL